MDIKKICLGTVQFGMKYGIANTKGMPSRKESFQMLDIAWGHGIRYFDTAYAYGDAEEILGEYIKVNGISNEIKVISKLRPNCITDEVKNIVEFIKKEICFSLEKLNIESLDSYLLHTPAYVRNPQILYALASAKSRKYINNYGVSIYEIKDAIYAAEKKVDSIQVPYSVFDQRANNPVFKKLIKENNVTVFARSVFLQGLLFMNEKNIPIHMHNAKVLVKKFNEILKRFGLTVAQGTIMFSNYDNSHDFNIWGVDNINQLKENLKVLDDDLLIEEFMLEIQKTFNRPDDAIIFPSLWTDPNKKCK